MTSAPCRIGGRERICDDLEVVGTLHDGHLVQLARDISGLDTCGVVESDRLELPSRIERALRSGSMTQHPLRSWAGLAEIEGSSRTSGARVMSMGSKET